MRHGQVLQSFLFLEFRNSAMIWVQEFFPLAWVHVLETVVLHVYSDLRKWLS